VTVDKARREDWIVAGLALLLVIDLLELPWHTIGGVTISGISLPSISDPATGPPAALLGVLAVLASLAVLLDVVVEHLSPETSIPSIGGNRSLTRYLLAIAAAACIGLKFVLHLTQIGNLGVGFWFGAPLAAALVYATRKARRDEPQAGGRRSEPAASESDDSPAVGAGPPQASRSKSPEAPGS
jgi:hypothetical protein